MSERLQLAGIALSILVVLTALGSGPTALLGGGRRVASLAFAPATGLALGAGVLTGAAYVMPMRIAAWAVLLPLAAVSAGVAAVVLRRGPRRFGVADLTAPGLALVALLLAIAPGLARGSLGPFSLNTQDTFAFSHMDLWLRDNTLRAAPPADAGLWDLSILNGHAYAVASNSSVFRVGVNALGSALSVLVGQDPAASQLAFLAVLFAMLPLAAWGLARGVGADRPVAALAAVVAIGPAAFTLVADSIMANLGGLVMVAPLVLLAGRGVVLGSRRDLVHGAILLGGVVAVYPEFLPPVVGIAALGGIAAVLMRRPGASARATAIRVALRLAALAAVAGLVAPMALWRGVRYSASVASADPSSSIFRGTEYPIGLDNAASWALGLTPLYDLQPVRDAGVAGALLAVALPLALLGLVVLGALRLGRRRAAVIVIPLLTSALAGAAAGSRFGQNGCSYCMWKGFTFSLPFLAAAVAVGAGAVPAVTRARSWSPALAAGAAGVVAVTLGFSTWNAVALSQDVALSPEYTPTALRRVAAAAREVPAPATVMIEGAESNPSPWFSIPATYDLLRAVPGVRPAFDPEGAGERARVYLSPAPPVGLPAWMPRAQADYASSRYGYVLSSFGDLRDGRRVLRQAGPYSFERRAAVDVTVQRTGPPAETPTPHGARPSIGGPFELWISSPSAGAGHLILSSWRGSEARGPFAMVAGDVHRSLSLAPGTTACLTVLFRAGTTRVRVLRGPKGEALVLTRIAAGAGPCTSPRGLL